MAVDTAVLCAKMAEPIEMPFRLWTRVGRMACIRWGAYWHNLANTIELSVCSGDEVHLSNCFEHLFILLLLKCVCGCCVQCLA